MSNYIIIKDEQSLIDYLENIVADELPTAFDTETTGLKKSALLLGVSIYNGKRVSAFVPTNYYFKDCLSISTIIAVCSKYFPLIDYGVAHNAKYDLGVFQTNGIPDIKVVSDTLVMAHTYDSSERLNLEHLTEKIFKKKKLKFNEIIGKKWDKIDWLKDQQESYDKKGNVVPPILSLEVLAEYACDDTIATLELESHYRPLLTTEGLIKVHDKIEIPMISTLRDMYSYGVYIDKNVLAELSARAEPYKESLLNKIYNEAGCVFNVNSGKQKADVLYDKLGLKCYGVTPGGSRSTDSNALEKLAAEGHEIAIALVEYSTIQKLLSGYIDAIPRLLDEDGRLRGSINSCGTKTGRFSSSDPNLQNQPNNKEFSIRSAFVAPRSRILVGADYSQIELRVMGHCANDAEFIRAFKSGKDIHQTVADALGITRSHAKVVNFGVLYGMGVDTLASNLKVSSKVAAEIIRGYHNSYSGYSKWSKWTTEMARKNGYVKNMFGRIRRFHFNDSHKAVNTVIQGGAADIIKLAMNKINAKYKLENLDAHLVLQVHDELIVDCSEQHAVQAHDILVDLMETTVKLSLPLVADAKIIPSWDKMKDDNFKSLYPHYKNQSFRVNEMSILDILNFQNK